MENVVPLRYNTFYKTHLDRIDLALASAMPFIVIFTVNTVIIVKLTLKSKNLTSSSKTSSMTAILISVSVTFLVFTLPITIHMLLYSGDFYSTATELEYAQLEVEWAVVNIVYYLNNSTNFFLYCISGPSFRREFLALISRNRVQPLSYSLITPKRSARVDSDELYLTMIGILVCNKGSFNQAMTLGLLDDQLSSYRSWAAAHEQFGGYNQ
ncbi:hypothetical protein CAPTEDRAFT_190469 [Capitella teleta]|uniref:G-protein coupled receptors family 1 profile domain-containing protein n=1 Tax=Capitella teleta TaxID=283909 RepID=R7UKN4_CAPTE|nr:hypothetical protein CAPTEDRAFT_190469 [Capitella teleta]|eukprot:ELU03837.1 hypothetical protein CAPTEDRAFT_190469 [Capitella teleta]